MKLSMKVKEYGTYISKALMVQFILEKDILYNLSLAISILSNRLRYSSSEHLQNMNIFILVALSACPHLIQIGHRL